MDQMLGMLPKVGIFKDAGKANVDEKELTHIEAIINSMTPRSAAITRSSTGGAARGLRRGAARASSK